MNLEEVKRVGPSYPQDIDWGFCAYCKYLEISGDILIYEISGVVLIYVVGRFPDELTAISLGIYTLRAGTRLLRVGVFNPDTFQCQTNGLNFHTTYYPVIGLYNSQKEAFLISS